MDGVTARGKTVSPEGIRGWLLAYVIMLGLLALHGLGLTAAALIVNADPSLAGLDSFVPLPSLLLYVTSNAFLILYTIMLYVLMFKRRKSAIANNIIFNALSIAFLLSWHILGMKSTLGLLVDSAPGVIGIWYIVASTRVRNTFTRA
ncbi:DUF2569 family protein [Actinomadura sp. 21ATH]|uniref:DUF2569 family protein n=1 Tax=Actinomadura sp. 21ATH TaxID=1735444 RepID=UPI0035C03C34